MTSKVKRSVKNKNLKKGFSLREEYIKSWKYLKESKKFIFIVIFLFFFSAILGFFVSPPEILSKSIMELLKGLVEKTQGMGGLELIAFIFLNNLQTSFSGMVFGFLFGIFPVITTLVNGYLLGFVSSMSVNVDSFASLLKLLPHGIFELPAVFISLGIGWKFGDEFIKEYLNIKSQTMRYVITFLSALIGISFVLLLYLKSITILGVILFFMFLITFILVFSKKTLKSELLNGIRIFLLIVLPLLLIAAIIEGSLIFLLA